MYLSPDFPLNLLELAKRLVADPERKILAEIHMSFYKDHAIMMDASLAKPAHDNSLIRGIFTLIHDSALTFKSLVEKK